MTLHSVDQITLQERKLLKLLEAESLNSTGNTSTISSSSSSSSISQQIIPFSSSRGSKGTQTYQHLMTVIKSYTPPLQNEVVGSGIESIKGPLIVIIRHGKTEHNKLGLFTGWEDAPLAAEGMCIALLFIIILYCLISYYTVLYCTVLYCTVL